ncbi:protein-tyrosine phosphatase-like protein [Cyathus striatus]|nr:protein-tyrosine phosphatase-like protein [Cyathus striatus]
MIRFENLLPEVIQAMGTPMHQILAPTAPPLPAVTGTLYIGSLSTVNDKDLLKAHNFTHLVQVLDVPWLPISEKDGFNCYRIAIHDAANVNLRPHLEAVCAHIDRALRGGEKCACSLSATYPALLIAYLIRNYGMSFKSAYALCRHKRACVKPNQGFVQALQEWEGAWKRPGITRRFTS